LTAEPKPRPALAIGGALMGAVAGNFLRLSSGALI